MYDSFDPFSVCLYMKKPTTRQYEIQCELYRTLVGGGDHKYENCVYIHVYTCVTDYHATCTCNVHLKSTSLYCRGLDVIRPATIAQSSKRSSVGSCGNSSQVYQPLATQLDTQTCTDYYVLMNPRDKVVTQVSLVNVKSV